MASPLVSHLAHVELLTPDPAETARFLIGERALTLVDSDECSAYLRAPDDLLRYSLKVTTGSAAGVGHVAWRSCGAQALREAVAALAASGRGLGWTEGDVGHGRAYRFQSPSGHVHELLWEADPPPLGDVPGATTMRKLDHVALACATPPLRDADFFVDTLAFQLVSAAHDGAMALLSATGHGYHVSFIAAPAGAQRGLDHVGMLLARAGRVRLTEPGGNRIEGDRAEAAAVSPAFSGHSQ